MLLDNLLLRLQDLLARGLVIVAHHLLKRNGIQRHRKLLLGRVVAIGILPPKITDPVTPGATRFGGSTPFW